MQAVLQAAEPRPDPGEQQHKKTQYAERFAVALAAVLARDLGRRLPGIAASTKRTAKSAHGMKQLDVNFSTPELGLALGISLKSVHLRDATGGDRYTHNMKRNEEELRIEASGYHRRQPYAVLVGLLCLPIDSCSDAKTATTASSFGSWVRHLRPYTGRMAPSDEADRLERLYVLLYAPDGSALQFFDVRCNPPRNGLPPQEGQLFDDHHPQLPRRLLSYIEFLDEVHRVYGQRNSTSFDWAD